MSANYQYSHDLHEGQVRLLPGEPDHSSVRRHLDALISSPYFANSKRFPIFLRYVVEETLRGRGEHLKERTLGVEVFGRKPDYDTSLDHVVRSTASEVRKRLALYYEKSNGCETIRIDLPPGSYRPEFRHHQTDAGEIRRRSIRSSTNAAVAQSWRLLPFIVVGVVLLLGGAVVGFTAARATAKPANSIVAGPDSLLSALIPKQGQKLDVILSDTALAMLSGYNRGGSMVSLEDYKSRRFLQQQNLPQSLESDSMLLRMLKNTNGIDAYSLPLITRILEVVPARQVSIKHPAEVISQDFYEDDALLIGGPRVDPWVQLFEGELNFKTELIRGDRSAGSLETSKVETGGIRPIVYSEFRNSVPTNNEPTVYSDTNADDSNAKLVYGRIAYLPNLLNNGKVLLVSGPSIAATEAAANFAMDPAALHIVFELFRVARLGDLPPFELLLQVRARDGAVLQSKVVAWRKIEGLRSQQGSSSDAQHTVRQQQ